METSPIQSRRTIRAVLALCLLGSLLVFGFVVMRDTKPARVSSQEIPLPFGSIDRPSLRGALTDIGTVGDRRFMEMTFDAGEISETFRAGDITFVLTPEDPDAFSAGAPFSVALSTDSGIYGYIYTSKDATLEREMQALLQVPDNETAYNYSQLYPGTFFASTGDLADPDSFINNFQKLHPDVTFRPLTEVFLAADKRFLVITKSEEITLTVRDLSWCGDGTVQSPEMCDDGNKTNGDACSAQCTTEQCGNGILETTIGKDATRTTASAVTTYLQSIGSGALDVDGNGVANALTDGITITKYMNGIQGPDLVKLSVDPKGSRTTPEAVLEFLNENYLAYDVDGNGTLSSAEDGAMINRFLFKFTGNSLVGEECDDGNTVNGDRCNAMCTIEIVKSGNLFVTKSSIPVRERQSLGGTLAEVALRLTFHADKESVDVTAIRMSTNLSSRSIDRLELYKIGTTVPFGVATMGGCGGWTAGAVDSFCITMSGSLVVVPGTDVDVLVHPRIKTDQDGGVSGDEFKIRLLSQVSTVEGKGLTSGLTLKVNNGNAAADGEVFVGTGTPAPNMEIGGSYQQIVMSKVVKIANANPNPDGTAVPAGIAAVGQFKFTTAANSNGKNGLNQVVLTSVILSVDAANVAFDTGGFKLYNKADSTVKSECYPLDSFTTWPSFMLACWDVSVAGVNTAIDSGSDATFVLEMNILNPAIRSSEDSTLQVSLKNFSDPKLIGMASNLSHIRWLDKDAGPLDETQFWWIDSSESVVRSTRYSGASGPVCGNAIIESPEQCDGGAQNTTTCSAAYGQTCNYCEVNTCQNKTVKGPFCGDGVKQEAGADGNLGTSDDEQCDKGASNGTGLCSAACKIFFPVPM